MYNIAFILYVILFSVSFVGMLLSMLKRKDSSAFFILTAYSFITLCYQLEWSMLTHLDGLLTNTPR
jgi:hypothetical protein